MLTKPFFLVLPDTWSIFEHQKRLFANRSSEVDVCLIDLIWTDALTGHLLDLNENFIGELRTCFPVYVENNTVNGRLVAVPYSVELGLLYYWTDLLAKHGFAAPPATWNELEVMAAEIHAAERAAGRFDFWGFVWQGENSDGQTCCALEWQVSHGGERLIEPDGVIMANNPHANAAFERAARWVGTSSPEAVTQTGLGDSDENIKT